MSGYSVALVDDVDDDGQADLLVGEPNTANGQARLYFGDTCLQDGATSCSSILYLGEQAGQQAGSHVAGVDDVNGDGLPDFAIGAPGSSSWGADTGAAYVVFGDSGLTAGTRNLSDLASCAGSHCGAVFVGESSGDMAGAAISAGGDLNGDGVKDLLIAAPQADPNGADSGKVYLIYGPLTGGVVQLSTVGSTTPGIVFHGENAGDLAGYSISRWPAFGSDPLDDLLIGAPGADSSVDGAVVSNAGYLYIVQGGFSNLQAKAVGGVIELSRVANGSADEVAGFVIVGVTANGQLGLSCSGEGGAQGALRVGAVDAAFVIPGNSGIKTSTGSSPTGGKRRTVSAIQTLRVAEGENISERFGAVALTPAEGESLGRLIVGPAGDFNGDGLDDTVIGAPDAGDGGRVYVIFGTPTPTGDVVELGDVGDTVAGLVVDGVPVAGTIELGHSVAAGFDINGDGLDDVVAGAPSDGAGDEGASYVLSPREPAAVTTLRLAETGSGTRLEWDKPDRAMVYNLYRDAFSAAPLGPVVTSLMTATCAFKTDTNGNGLPDTLDPADPAGGEVFVYLVTGENRLGEGPLVQPLTGVPRENDDPCP
jgi:hypothetical protein